MIWSGDGLSAMAQHMMSHRPSAPVFNNLQAQYLNFRPRLGFPAHERPRRKVITIHNAF